MRKTPAALVSLAALSFLATALVGCVPTGEPTCSRPAVSEPAVMDLISVSGGGSSIPTVDVPVPFRTTTGGFEDIVEGEGTPLTAANQLVAMDVALVDGTTGEIIITTPYDGDLTSVFALAQWSQTFPVFEEALHCATEGSRVVVALAPGDIAAETAASLGMAEDASGVAVVDLRKVYLPRAQGTLQFNTGNNLPSVVRAPDGRPGVIIPDAAPPSDVVVQTLINGDGPVVTGDAPVRVHYTGLTWADKEVFDTSWDTAPASLTLDSVVPGFAQALDGQTVGSQVMVVVPPDAGYGDQEQPGIPAGSTLVFVIDILGLDAGPAR